MNKNGIIMKHSGFVFLRKQLIMMKFYLVE